jgi:hypothetical protein
LCYIRPKVLLCYIRPQMGKYTLLTAIELREKANKNVEHDNDM